MHRIFNIPMQFRGPVEKGINAPGGISFTFVSLNLSGSNFEGSGKYLGFIFISSSETKIGVPFGIFWPSSTDKTILLLTSLQDRLVRVKHVFANQVKLPLL